MGLEHWYVLGGQDGRQVLPCGGDLSGNTHQPVAKTTLCGHDISTVFLGLDHRYDYSTGEPLVFETMIFGGPLDQKQWRYSSWAAAEAGHLEACRLVQYEERWYRRVQRAWKANKDALLGVENR
jgi:hypothetical protein